MMDPVIELRDITKSYRTGSLSVDAIAGISLIIQAGEFVAIAGPSGSGKSTLMHILGCLDVPTTGNYLLAGQDVGTLAEDSLAASATAASGSCFNSSTCWRRCRLGATSSCRWPTPACRGSRDESEPSPRCHRSGSVPGSSTVRPSCRAVSNSGWPWPGPS